MESASKPTSRVTSSKIKEHPISVLIKYESPYDSLVEVQNQKFSLIELLDKETDAKNITL